MIFYLYYLYNNIRLKYNIYIQCRFIWNIYSYRHIYIIRIYIYNAIH